MSAPNKALPLRRPAAALLYLACALPVSGIAIAEEQLLLRLQAGDLTPKIAEFIGTNGRLTKVATESARPLREVVETVCGQAPDAFMRALQVANDDDALDYSRVIAPGVEFEMPPCPPRPEVSLFARQVKPGDNLWKYHQESALVGLASAPSATTSTVSGAGTFVHFPIREFEAFPGAPGPGNGYQPENFDLRRPSMVAIQYSTGDNLVAALGELGLAPGVSDQLGSPVETSLKVDLTSGSFSSYLDLVKAANPGFGSIDELKPGEVWLTPDLRSHEFVLPLRDEATARRLAALTAQEFSAALGRPVQVEVVHDDIQLMTRVNSTTCAQGDLSWDDDGRPKSLKDIMADNWERTNGVTREPPRIVIVDSGVYEAGALPGRPTILRPVRSVNAVSLHGNYPIEREIRPYDRMPERMHGTNVATLALGGQAQAAEAYDIGYRNALQPFRAYGEKTGLAQRADGSLIITDGQARAVTYVFDRDSVLDAINYAGRDIVNLSLGRSSLFQEITARSLPHSPTLFVVAAGNERNNLDLKTIYPAAQGGRHSPNVITVASIDGDGKLSDFSNWSVDYVDIAAPGCKVPTLSYDVADKTFFEEAVSGTSFSAPQVTWIAAALRAVRPQAPASVLKMRILAGADIDPALAGKIHEGRVLNPHKTLALHYDVVDMGRGDARRLVFGRLQGSRSPERFCTDSIDLQGAELLKVVPQFDGNGARPGTTRLHFATSNGLVKQANCATADFELVVETEGQGQLEHLPGSEINDVTFSWQ